MHQNMNKPKFEESYLARKLELSAEQIDSIQPILDSMLPTQSRMRRLHHEELKIERNKMYMLISPYLTDDQRQKLDKIKQHGSRNFKRYRDNRRRRSSDR